MHEHLATRSFDRERHQACAGCGKTRDIASAIDDFDQDVIRRAREHPRWHRKDGGVRQKILVGGIDGRVEGDTVPDSGHQAWGGESVTDGPRKSLVKKRNAVVVDKIAVAGAEGVVSGKSAKHREVLANTTHRLEMRRDRLARAKKGGL